MKRLIPFAVAAVFATTAASAFAEEQDGTRPDVQAAPGPVVMTDDQMDRVAAGDPLLVVSVNNTANNILRNVDVDINANLAAAAVVLGGKAAAGAVQLP
jgi:hypothetical protein